MTLKHSICLAGILGAVVASGVADSRAQDAAPTWSEPAQIGIPSDVGPLTVQTRTSAVSGHSVDLIYSAAYNAAWIGPRAGTYFALNRVIWSCSAIGPRLALRHSVGSVTVDQLDAFAASWLEGSRTQAWNRAEVAGTIAFDFMHVFGPRALMPYGHAELVPSINLVSVAPEVGRVTFGCGCPAGNKLELVYSAQMDLLAGRINGEPVLLLLDGKLADWKWPGGWRPWFAPEKVSVASPAGLVAALKCDSFLSEAILLPGSGDLWVGPKFCKLALLNGTMVGLTTDYKGGNLLIYLAQPARIPMVEGQTIPAFQAALKGYDADLAACRAKPDKSVKISDLFSGKDASELASAQGIELREIQFAGNDLVLRFNVELYRDPNAPIMAEWPPPLGPITKVQLTLAPDLSISAPQVGSPAQRQ